MAIDAKVDYVTINEDGSGQLNLVDRPARPGQVPGIVGQRALRFDSAPEEVTALNGLEVWGSANCLMLGDIEIAKRRGYTSIVFYDIDTFKRAIAAYHDKRRQREQSV